MAHYMGHGQFLYEKTPKINYDRLTMVDLCYQKLIIQEKNPGGLENLSESLETTMRHI